MSRYWKGEYSTRMGLAIMQNVEGKNARLAAIILFDKATAEELADAVISHLESREEPRDGD